MYLVHKQTESGWEIAFYFFFSIPDGSFKSESIQIYLYIFIQYQSHSKPLW